MLFPEIDMSRCPEIDITQQQDSAAVYYHKQGELCFVWWGFNGKNPRCYSHRQLPGP